MFYKFSNVLVFILSHLDNVAPMGLPVREKVVIVSPGLHPGLVNIAPMGLGYRSPIEKDLTFRAKGLDVWALRTGRLGQNVVTFEPKIRVFWPEISVPFCGEEGLVIKNACVRICPSLRVRACATPRHTSASEGGSTVMSQKSHCSLSNTYKGMTGLTGRLYDFLQEKNRDIYNR